MTEAQRKRCKESRQPGPSASEPARRARMVKPMGFLREVELGASFAPFAAFREYFGFVPSLFRCQSLLPRLVEAETSLATSILFQDRALSRKQKECLLLVLATANRNGYCATAHYPMLDLLGEPEERSHHLLP